MSPLASALPPLPSPEEARLALLLAWAVLGYLAYHYGARALARRGGPGTPASVFGGRILGALCLGLPSLLWAALRWPELLALWAPPSGAALLAAGAAWLALAPALWLAAGGATHRARYPQLRREAPWGGRLLLAEAASWALYLLGYEWCFRGLLVVGLASLIGLWPALILGTGLYVLAHLDKDPGEALACVPMGLGFGLLVWWSQSLWPAVLLHLGLALAGNLFPLLRRAPEPAAGPGRPPPSEPFASARSASQGGEALPSG